MALALATVPAAAEDPKPIGTFSDWVAFTFKSKKGPVCFIHSQPKKAELSRKGARRGDVHFMVTNRPGEKVFGEVQIYIGYPLKKESTVSLEIDGNSFDLIAVNEEAWASDPESDRKIVKAMQAGSKMVVKGVSQRGTKSNDRYSLSGVTAALKKISSTCK